MAHSTVANLSYIDRIGKHHVERAARERVPLVVRVSVARAAKLRNRSALVELLLEQPHTAKLQIAPKDLPDHFRFSRVNDQAPLPQVVTQRYYPTHPNALAPGGRDLVANSFRGYFAFELREREQHIECEPAHRGRGVEPLRDRHEGDVMLIEQLDYL